MSSCSSNKGFQNFYNDHKNEANLALSFPKWIAIPFINEEEREVVKSLSKGMKRIRFIYNEEENISDQFSVYSTAYGYDKFFYTKSGEEAIELYALQDNDSIKEIVLSLGSEEEAVIIAILGKMSKDKFNKEIGPHLKNAL